MAAADERMAASLGLPSAVVMDYRVKVLLEGKHYTREPGSGRIDYTADGVAALTTALRSEKKEGAPPAPTPPPASAAPPKKKEAALPTAPGQPVLLKVLHYFPNRIWVAVQDPQGTRRIVRVKNHTLHDRNSRLRCRQWPEPDGRWECCHGRQAVPLKPLVPEGTQTDGAADTAQQQAKQKEEHAMSDTNTTEKEAAEETADQAAEGQTDGTETGTTEGAESQES